MKRSPAPQQLSFASKLERLAEGIEYYAVPVPAKISHALGTRGPVPVSARVNDSHPFIVSLYPQGGGRHGLRVKAEVRQETGIKEGDRVQVQITVRDRNAEVALPADLEKILRTEGMLEHFNALPIGKRSHTLGWIDEAVRPETREKRVLVALEMAYEKREKRK